VPSASVPASPSSGRPSTKVAGSANRPAGAQMVRRKGGDSSVGAKDDADVEKHNDKTDLLRVVHGRASRLRGTARRLPPSQTVIDELGRELGLTNVDEHGHYSAGDVQRELTRLADDFDRSADVLAGKKRNQRAVETLYADAQRHWSSVQRIIVGKRIIAARVGSEREGAEAFELVTMDVDDRASRLAALLTTKSNTTGADRFRSLMPLLAGGEAAKLKARYKLLRQGTDLEADIVRTYRKQPLRVEYLKEVLANGAPSVAGRTALKLGLLYSRWTPADLKDKDRLRALARQAPNDFRWLVEGDDSTELKKQVLRKLAGTGFLGELKSYLNVVLSGQGDDVGGSRYEKSSDPQVNYLFSLIFNLEQRTIWTDEFRGQTVFHDRRNLAKFSMATKGLKDALLHWVGSIADDRARAAFVAAGVAQFRMDDEPPESADKRLVAEYRAFWRQVVIGEAMTNDKAEFVIRIANGRGKGTTHDPRNLLDELDATMTFHHADKNVLKRRMARSDMKHYVMRLLSASGDDGSDPVMAIIEKYNPSGFKRLQKQPDDTRRRQAFGKAFVAFEPVLERANLTDDQRIQIKQFLLEGGTEDDTGNDLGVYLKLKKKARDQHPESHSTDRMIELLAMVTPRSKQAELIRNDPEITRYVQHAMDIMHLTGPKRKIWERLQTTNARSESSAGYWAARLAATHHHDHDGNRGLEIAWEAQQAGADPARVGRKLQRDFPEAHRVMAERGSRFKVLSPIGKRLDNRGERSAYKVLHDWLQDGERITADDLFHAARAMTKLGVSSEDTEFALNAITAENVFEYVHAPSLEKLKSAADRRFAARLDIQEQRLALSGQQDDPKAAAKTEARIAALELEVVGLTERIRMHDLEISSTLVKRMGKVYRAGALGAAKRRIYGLMGVALAADTDDDVDTPDEVQSLKLSQAELGFKGGQMKAKSEVLEQRSIESGATWDHRTTIGAQTSESLAIMLTRLRTAEDAVMKASGGQDHRGGTARADRETKLRALQKAQADVDQFQLDFKAAQDRLNKQTVKIVTTLLSIAITVAGLVTGLGAALGFVQLMWAVGASLLQSAVKLALEAGLGREGEHSKAEAAKDTLVQLFGDVLAATVAAELTLAIDLSGVGIHTGTAADQIFGKPALAFAKSQVSKAVGAVAPGIEHELFGKHPIQGLMPAIRQGLVDKVKSLPVEFVTTYLQGVVTESFRLGGKEILGDLAWAPSGGLASNKYVVTNDDESLDTSAVTTAQHQLFGRNLGDTSGNWMQGSAADWFNSWGIFVGSPTSDVGADTTLLAPGGGDWDGKKFGSYLGASLKTVFYEELVVARMKAKVGTASETLVLGALGVQGKEYSGAYEIDHDDHTEQTDVRSGPAELDVMGHLEAGTVPDVQVDPTSTADRLLADVYRDWGLRVGGNTESDILAALAKLGQPQAGRATALFMADRHDLMKRIVELNDLVNEELKRQAAADASAKPKQRRSGKRAKSRSKRGSSSTTSVDT
jgi:hypothetical protein